MILTRTDILALRHQHHVKVYFTFDNLPFPAVYKSNTIVVSLPQAKHEETMRHVIIHELIHARDDLIRCTVRWRVLLFGKKRTLQKFEYQTMVETRKTIKYDSAIWDFIKTTFNIQIKWEGLL